MKDHTCNVNLTTMTKTALVSYDCKNKKKRNSGTSLVLSKLPPCIDTSIYARLTLGNVANEAINRNVYR